MTRHTPYRYSSIVILLCTLCQPLTAVIAASDTRGAGAVARDILTSGNGDFNLYDQSHALLIGNINYQHWNRLPAIRSELGDVAQMLEAQGFQVHTEWDLDANT